MQRNIHDLQQEWGKSKFIIWNDSKKINMQKFVFHFKTPLSFYGLADIKFLALGFPYKLHCIAICVEKCNNIEYN